MMNPNKNKQALSDDLLEQVAGGEPDPNNQPEPVPTPTPPQPAPPDVRPGAPKV